MSKFHTEKKHCDVELHVNFFLIGHKHLCAMNNDYLTALLTSVGHYNRSTECVFFFDRNKKNVHRHLIRNCGIVGSSCLVFCKRSKDYAGIMNRFARNNHFDGVKRFRRTNERNKSTEQYSTVQYRTELSRHFSDV